MDPEDNIKLLIIAVNLITVHILLSAHPQDTFSRKLDRLRKSTAQDNQLTRLSHYINTGFPCETKNIGNTGTHYPSKMVSSPVDPELLFHKRCEQRCYSTFTMDIRVRKDAH